MDQDRPYCFAINTTNIFLPDRLLLFTGIVSRNKQPAFPDIQRDRRLLATGPRSGAGTGWPNPYRARSARHTQRICQKSKEPLINGTEWFILADDVN
jgi:hypothetical protein